MNFFLGFDVAKDKLDYSLINEQGIELCSGKVANDEAAIATLLLTISGHYQDADITSVVEATGCYHHPLVEACQAVNLPVRIFNPILTRQQIKSSVRAKKTDKTDALMIARLGLRGEGRLWLPEPYRATKHYARSCQKLSIYGSSFKLYNNHITSLLKDDLSSEVVELMNGVQEAIAAARRQLYRDLATSAKGDTFNLLQTIPGVGPYVAASLIGEIQNIKRFSRAKALIAFAGLDPRIKQSGKTLNTTGKLTKRGSSYLRHSIFIAANVAKRCDPVFKATYDKKRAEGKRYTVANCIVSRKLLKTVRAVWISGKPYDPNYEKQLT